MSPDSSLGVYLHVPFCERICPYCDFAVVRASRGDAAGPAAYVDAVLRELEARRGSYRDRRLESLYLGGGTPALLPVDAVARLVAAVRDTFAGDPVEVTLEANPSTLERERLAGFRRAGVNRLSLGIQSFDDAVLHRLGRAHRAEAGRETLRAARAAGFDNLSLDLIFAAPGQRLADVERDLAEATAFEPEHVSAYQLTVEEGTPFALAAARGQLALADEDESARMFERVAERLEEAGLYRYEISSHARPGREARHNRRYWERRPVLGLGMGAWSTEAQSPAAPHGARRANVRDLGRYLASAGGPGGCEARLEPIEAATARGEAMFLALRTRQGLSAERFRAEFGAPPRAFFGDAIAELTAAALLAETDDGSLRLTPRGILLSDTVAAHFV